MLTVILIIVFIIFLPEIISLLLRLFYSIVSLFGAAGAGIIDFFDRMRK